MEVSKEQFEQWLAEAIDKLPDELLERVNNVAFFVEDYPTKEQKKKAGIARDESLLGLYEGYQQGRKRPVSGILPDKITLFRKAIAERYGNEHAVKDQIYKTLKHEIAHHFGSDEEGARKAAISSKIF